MSEGTINSEAPAKNLKDLRESYAKVRNAVNTAVSKSRTEIETAETSGEKFPNGLRRVLMRTARHAAYDAATVKQEEVNEVSKKIAVDDITGLMTKKLFEETLRREVELTRRDEARKLGFTFIDIDNFGQFNKRHGQRTGDKVLGQVGNTILQHIRKTDIAGRDGGEEMGIIMPYTGTEQPLMEDNPSERVRHAISEIKLDGVEQITASVGTTDFFDTESYEDFFDRADLAMRVAKKLGKNRTVTAQLDAEKGVIFQDLSTGKKYTATVKYEGEHKVVEPAEVTV